MVPAQKSPGQCPGPLSFDGPEDSVSGDYRCAPAEAIVDAGLDRVNVSRQSDAGVMRALNRGHVREFTSRKDTHWGKRKLKRDA
jgi:hypothetical protein